MSEFVWCVLVALVRLVWWLWSSGAPWHTLGSEEEPFEVLLRVLGLK